MHAGSHVVFSLNSGSLGRSGFNGGLWDNLVDVWVRRPSLTLAGDCLLQSVDGSAIVGLVEAELFTTEACCGRNPLAMLSFGLFNVYIHCTVCTGVGVIAGAGADTGTGTDTTLGRLDRDKVGADFGKRTFSRCMPVW